MASNHHLYVDEAILFIPICLLIVLILLKRLSYQRAIIGGAIAGVGWRIPAFLIMIFWDWWAEGMSLRIPEGTALPLSEFVFSAIVGALFGATIVSIWKIAEFIIRTVRSSGGRSQS